MFEGATVAVCHEWTLRRAGSEQVAAAVADLLQPDAVFTLAASEEAAAEVFGHHRVITTGPGRAPAVQARWDRMLPVLHAGWRSLDLSEFDVVVTSSHSCVNALRVGPRTRVVTYCHTPMRYAWEWREEIGRVPRALRPVWPVAAGALQRIDRATSRKVDLFIANSHFVADRIRRAYDRPSVVVPPPVDTDFYAPPREGHAVHDGDADRGDFFLVAGRLVGYKRPDIAVDAARLAGVPLVVAGDGPVRAELEARAEAGTRFVPSPTDAELRDLYRRARALVFPGVEDFGITPVEAMACGTPVIARNRGGATESVVDGVSGRLVDGGTAESFAEVLRGWPASWPRAGCRRVAEGFSPTAFRRGFLDALDRLDAAIG